MRIKNIDQIHDRYFPRHTNEIRERILADLRALSATQSPVEEISDEPQFTMTYNPKCPRGEKGARGRNFDTF
jgi:hypothetical protein